MNEQIKIMSGWLGQQRPFVLARVIKTWGSSPRPIGSILLISDRGEMSGSVSGGCVEGAVAKEALQVLEGGRSKLLQFGVTDEDAWSVGLSCGGQLEVFLQKVDPNKIWNALIDSHDSNQGSILVSPIQEVKTYDTLLSPTGDFQGQKISEEIKESAIRAFQQRTHQIIETGGLRYFIQVFPRKPQLLVIGAAHITVDLVSLASKYGFETIVIDPRGYFTENTTFDKQPDQLIEAYPSEVLQDFSLDAYTFCAILSHDPKIDDDALEILLPSNVAYIGALGSNKNQAKRRSRLLEKGFSEDQIKQIHGPIGADINARSAAEIALSIMAQIIQVKNAHLIR